MQPQPLDHRIFFDDTNPTWWASGEPAHAPAWLDDVDTVVVRLDGELDETTALSLRRSLDELGPQRRVIVDATDVSFCDLAGLFVLLNHAEHLADEGRALTLVPSPALRSAMEAADRHLPLAQVPGAAADRDARVRRRRCDRVLRLGTTAL